MKQVAEQTNVIGRQRFEQLNAIGDRATLPSLVSIQRFIDQRDVVLCRVSPTIFECLAQIASRRFRVAGVAARSLHRTDNGGSTELACAIDDAADESSRLLAFSGIGIGKL